MAGRAPLRARDAAARLDGEEYTKIWQTSDPAALDEGEPLSLDELRAVQLQRLPDTVRRAYISVRHHRRVLDEAGVGPGHVDALDVLGSLPFTTKDDLRAN